MRGSVVKKWLRVTAVYWSAITAIAIISWIGTICQAQVDQGAITGFVEDSSGAVIPNVQVTVNNVDTGLTFQVKTNGSGVYVVAPLKIGNYTVTATASGFKTVTRENLHVDAQQRLSVNITLPTGAVSQTVNVTSAPPLLQTDSGSVSQTIETSTINNTPLNGRNWVYIAQLTAGVTPTLGNTRGNGTGDFVANGQNAEQNNFILNGVDNNTNLVDYLNGSSYVMRPPPDALSEFSLETSNYSAEFGHSAGAVMNASIKSGTNQVHGDFWEYFRNTNLDAQNWNALTNPPYHENQFGGTLGFPIFRNKLFYFGDAEANRISIGQTNTLTVPTALMRQGNFSELLDTSLTGEAQPVQLYQPNSGGAAKLSCNGQNNVFCSSQIDSVAQRILNLYPQPNTNGGKTFNNLVENVAQANDTWQWDQRLDWNPSRRDQAYATFSYLHNIVRNQFPLGPILDGSGYGGGNNRNVAENFMVSETHIFNPTLTNEFRFGFNWDSVSYQQANPNADVSTQLGLGGVPFAPGIGGLPQSSMSGISSWGTQGNSVEAQNVYQILDNVSKVVGNHSLKFGVSLQAIRVFYVYFQDPRGRYTYNGLYTSNHGASFTGFGVADFLANQMEQAYITLAPYVNDAQWYRSAYAQDDWKATRRLTLNLGVRYDYFQPYKEMSNQQANFMVTGPLGVGTGSGVYEIVNRSSNIPLGSAFPGVLAANNVSIQYVNHQRLSTAQDFNFAPRIGFAYRLDSMSVIHGGFGIFYGGLQNEGNGNLGSNFPFSMTATIPQPSCSLNRCPSTGVTLEDGLSAQTANGLQNFVSFPGFHSTDVHIKTPYTEGYSLQFERELTPSMAATFGYVGNVSRHEPLYWAPNNSPVLLTPGQSTQSYQAFPTLGGIGQINYSGVGTYNSLQAKIEKHYSRGLTFLATYTWGHNLDDYSDAGGLETAVGDRNMLLIPVIDEYTNSPYDVRQRVTLNGNYILPFGRGEAFLNHNRWADYTVGGWSTSLTFSAQTGLPFTVTPNISTAAGGSGRALAVRDPFAAGGSPDPSNPNITCASRTRNKVNWYNPCSFANPLPGNVIAPPGVTPGAGNSYLYASPVRSESAAIALLGGRAEQVYGPGYNRVNMSLFKNFTTWREEQLQFRADAFNLLNHPSLANPSLTGLNSTGGAITGPKSFQNDTPDARFFQLAMKYTF
jgi:hypothetical protein